MNFAIEGSSISMKGEWMQKLLSGKDANGFDKFIGKKGMLFSNYTLEKFIQEDVKHDKHLLSRSENRSIRTFSSGEQKKALLEYIINQHPTFIVLDNPYDCLDRNAVDYFKKKFIELSKEMPVIQVFKRKADVLPFIDKVIVVENEKYLKTIGISEFNMMVSSAGNINHEAKIPNPLHIYANIPEVLVEFRNVSVSYDERTILNNINWKVKKGEFWQLTGPNGSGKTTLLTMIYGDNPKAYGVDLFLFGHKKGTGESVWDIKQKIGYFTPAMTELFNGNYTLLDMVVSGLLDSIGLYKVPSDIQKDIAKEWLNTMGLINDKDEWFCNVSQIKQRMVLIARAMIKHPPLLILDEPSTGLDDKSAQMMIQWINKISGESNTAIIYVSHRKEEGLYPDFNYELVPSEFGSGGFMY